jgi:hypothetical protein
VIPFLLVIVVIVAVGVGVLAYRARPESSIESGIHSFRREMRALAPPPEHRRGPHDGPGAPTDVPPQDVE